MSNETTAATARSEAVKSGWRAVPDKAALLSPLWLGALGALGYYLTMYGQKSKETKKMEKEIQEARAARDAVFACLGPLFGLVEHLSAIEKQLRERLEVAEEALKKERADMMDKYSKDFKERQKLKERVEALEKENVELRAKLAEKFEMTKPKGRKK